MRKPSDAQIKYAQDIAYALNIHPPRYNNYLDIEDFLKCYVPIYKKHVRENTRVQNPKDRNFSADLIYFIESDPNTKGVYLLWDLHDKIAYIGRASTSRHRISSSIKEKMDLCKLSNVSYIQTETTADSYILEPILIIENKPHLNKEFNCADYSREWRSNININELYKIPIWEAVNA